MEVISPSTKKKDYALKLSKYMEAGVLLWDRNTLDRMSIGIKENIVEDVQEETKSGKGLLAGIIIAVVAIAAIAAYFLIIK